MTITTERFGSLSGGVDIDEYVLDNGRGIELRAITYGGIVTSLLAPDRAGRRASIVLGHKTLAPYMKNAPYLGAIIGRYANRVAAAAFTLDGHRFTLTANDGRHHLHGGPGGFHRRVWKAEPRHTAAGVGVVFSRISADGEEGYPGELAVTASYDLSPDGEVAIQYDAAATQPTVVNLTQHSYFDLSAAASPDVLDHRLMLDADMYLPVDDALIPLGDPAPVAGTPFDFRQATPIGTRIGSSHDQLRHGRGYDHTWILRGGTGPAASVAEPISGRTLDIWTSEPAVQFYSGNQLDGTVTAAGRVLRRHAGFCLETQHYPDSPNRPQYPSTLLQPSQRFSSRTVWRLGCL